MARPVNPADHHRGLMTIAVYKFVKTALLLALGAGALHYLHRDLAHEIAHWADMLRVDPHNHYLMWLMAHVAKVDEHRLKQLSIGTFFYATLFLCEGVGLAKEMRWAEYLTIVSTSSLLPVEVYEVFIRPGPARILVLLGNMVIVAYLVWVLRTTPRRKRVKSQ